MCLQHFCDVLVGFLYDIRYFYSTFALVRIIGTLLKGCFFSDIGNKLLYY